MLGAIIGDIIGSRWEFSPTNDYHFEWISAQNDYTDDTLCTVAVADAIVHQSDDYGSYIHCWCRSHPCPMGGYGGRFAQWVRSNRPQPYGSFGNGSAMRVSAIGWAFDETDDVLREAEKSAACSHNHPEGIRGAQAVALAIRDARHWKRTFSGAITPQVLRQQVLYRAIRLYSEETETFQLNLDDYRNRFDETCQGTVPVALWIVMHSHSFEDAIRRAVSLGADADTLGSIVGSIAEAIWGIPEAMKQQVWHLLPDEMKEVLKAFRHHLYNLTNKQKQVEDAILHWKLGLGNANNPLFYGKSALPEKTKTATVSDWKIQAMPSDRTMVTEVVVKINLSPQTMHILKKGHIPEAMEDHWFMYCDHEYIRYYRSWTGVCVFEAHYLPNGKAYLIDRIHINHHAVDLRANKEKAGTALFCYLLNAETEGEVELTWKEFLKLKS